MSRPKRTCTEDGCELPAKGRGLCSKHYQRAKYHNELPSEVTHACAECGAPVESRKWGAKYCSRPCNDRARYYRTRSATPHAENCEHCGAELPEGRNAKMKFCSGKCSQDDRNIRMAAERLAEKAAAARPCRGCSMPIPPERKANALYCSEQCKIKSRRHEAYGLTHEELSQLLAQHEKCAICGSDEWGRKGPCVDHCHSTGRVRGILCGRCNVALGLMDDDAGRLRTAAEYLERERR